MPICIRVICCKVVVEHQLQEFIELCARSDIRVQDVCDRAFCRLRAMDFSFLTVVIFVCLELILVDF